MARTSGGDGQDLHRGLPVGLPVVLAAQVVVVHAGGVGNADVDAEGNRARGEGVHGVLLLE
jgi:hypothetical protein